jgi:hypothetical protein
MSTETVGLRNHRASVSQPAHNYMVVDVHGASIEARQITDTCTQVYLTSNNFNGDPEYVVIYLYDTKLADILRAVSKTI